MLIGMIKLKHLKERSGGRRLPGSALLISRQKLSGPGVFWKSTASRPPGVLGCGRVGGIETDPPTPDSVEDKVILLSRLRLFYALL